MSASRTCCTFRSRFPLPSRERARVRGRFANTLTLTAALSRRGRGSSLVPLPFPVKGIGPGVRSAVLLATLFVAQRLACPDAPPRGTGDLGLVVERAIGRVQLIETSGPHGAGCIDGLGDLSHASIVYSRDGRYAYVFGRDGGLTKVDLLCRRIDKRVVQAGNSIGGAISQDGKLVAVANYQPGGVKVFSSETLELLADIPSEYAEGKRAKVVGLEDARQRSLRLQSVRGRRDLGRGPGRSAQPAHHEVQGHRQGALRRAGDAGRTLLHRRVCSARTGWRWWICGTSSAAHAGS